MLGTIYARQESWSTYDSKNPDKHWVGRSSIENRCGRIEVRTGVRHIPIVGVRIYAHEVDHLISASFRTDDDHHDGPAWAKAHGALPHYCGRSFSWRGFLSLKHLSSESIRCAKILIKSGIVIPTLEKGSRLADAVAPT